MKNAGASTTNNYESTQYRNAETGQIVNIEDYTATEIDSTSRGGALSAFNYTSTDDGAYHFSSSNNTTFKANQEVIQVSEFSQTQNATNDVTVKGINSENNIVADDDAEFTSVITKTGTSGTASGTASGSAGGSVSTTASASASSSSFINSFVQAY